MQDFGEAFRLAFGLVLTADPDLLEIITYRSHLGFQGVHINARICGIRLEFFFYPEKLLPGLGRIGFDLESVAVKIVVYRRHAA